jgi:WD40 repeat protein
MDQAPRVVSAVQGTRAALIVAADEYQDEKLRTLKAPAEDARALERVLADPRIGRFEVEVALNEPEGPLRRRIAAFFKNRAPDDFLLVHFACHGVKDDSGKLYFATPDTEWNNFNATAVPAGFVHEELKECRAGSIALLLDCCFSGAFSKGMTARAGEGLELRERFEGGSGLAILTAASSMEYAFEGDELSMEGDPSFFTGAIVRGLESGEAAGEGRGWVSVKDLHNYVARDVAQRTGKQTPRLWLFDLPGETLRIADVPPTRAARTARDYAKLTPFLDLPVHDEEGGPLEVYSVAISSDGRAVAAGTEGKVLLWRSDSPVSDWVDGEVPPPKAMQERDAYVYAVDFSRDGNLLASGGEDGAVHVTDVETGEAWVDSAHKEACYSVAFSTDGTQLASGGYDRQVFVRDVRSDRIPYERHFVGRISSVAFRPGTDDKVLAIGSLDNSVQLWAFEAGAEPEVLGKHDSSVEAVAFSSDGGFLATCGLDKAVRLWDLAEKSEQWGKAQHEYLVRAVAFSPVAPALVSAGWDKAMKVWDARTGAPLRMSPKHSDWIWAVRFSADGSVLASAGSDGIVVLWALADRAP